MTKRKPTCKAMTAGELKRERSRHGKAKVNNHKPLLESILNIMSIEGISLMKAYAALPEDKKTASYQRCTELLNDCMPQEYARAREEYAHRMVEKLTEIAENTEDVQRARLLCDNIKWTASKVLPRIYGDKVQQEVTHTNIAPAVSINITLSGPQSLPAIDISPVDSSSGKAIRKPAASITVDPD